MTTARNRATEVLVLDMSTIRFVWSADRTTCAAMTARGEIVSVYTLDRAGMSPREVAYELLNAALDRGQVLRAHPNDSARTVTYRLGLYNPFSGEVSVGAIPETVTFADGEPLTLPVDGQPALAVTTARFNRLELPTGRVLAPRELTFSALTRVHAAHQAA